MTTCATDRRKPANLKSKWGAAIAYADGASGSGTIVEMNSRLRLHPSKMAFEQIDAPLVADFLEDLETQRGLSVRSRNLRLAAIHSFFRYAAFEMPAHAAQIQRVLAIPSKRFTRKQVSFLNREEVDALLAAPDKGTWSGRRDHAFILTAVQTGLRVSEMTALKRQEFIVGKWRASEGCRKGPQGAVHPAGQTDPGRVGVADMRGEEFDEPHGCLRAFLAYQRGNRRDRRVGDDQVNRRGRIGHDTARRR